MNSVEKRNLLASFFMTLLLGAAFQEMVENLRDAYVAGDLSVETSLLSATFFLVSVRFFVGNQLHLLSDEFSRVPPELWFIDLVTIIAQCILFYFLASVATVEGNVHGKPGFVEFLLALYVLDVVWIFSQLLAGRIRPQWRRKFVPLGWAFLNSSLILGIYSIELVVDNIYSILGITLLCGLNVVGFVWDLFIIKHYGAFDVQ